MHAFVGLLFRLAIKVKVSSLLFVPRTKTGISLAVLSMTKIQVEVFHANLECFKAEE